jgi:hypothetical protein
MSDLKNRELKAILFPDKHPIPLSQVAHDLAVAKTTRDMTPDYKTEDFYFRYYYNYDEFMNFLEILEEKKILEIPLLKGIRPY